MATTTLPKMTNTIIAVPFGVMRMWHPDPAPAQVIYCPCGNNSYRLICNKANPSAPCKELRNDILATWDSLLQDVTLEARLCWENEYWEQFLNWQRAVREMLEWEKTVLKVYREAQARD